LGGDADDAQHADDALVAALQGIKSARGHIWKSNQHKELPLVFWAYQFVLHFLMKKMVVSGGRRLQKLN
jgi:hypothetical protein